MERTMREERRLEVLEHYQRYVEALRDHRLDADAPEVRRRRRALAHAIEAACLDDPDLLTDFKRSFASRPFA
jgi:hypothetical protein